MAFRYQTECSVSCGQANCSWERGNGDLDFYHHCHLTPRENRTVPEDCLRKLAALWKGLAMEQHHHLAAQVLFIAGRHWQLMGMLFILQVCVCALGCLCNWSKILNLSLSVSELTPTAVCWQMLIPNAWMGSLWSGHLLQSAPPISCFRTDEIWSSLLGAISIRWDEESHQAQLGNHRFRIPIRTVYQQLFRL